MRFWKISVIQHQALAKVARSEIRQRKHTQGSLLLACYLIHTSRVSVIRGRLSLDPFWSYELYLVFLLVNFLVDIMHSESCSWFIFSLPQGDVTLLCCLSSCKWGDKVLILNEPIYSGITSAVNDWGFQQ